MCMCIHVFTCVCVHVLYVSLTNMFGTVLCRVFMYTCMYIHVCIVSVQYMYIYTMYVHVFTCLVIHVRTCEVLLVCIIYSMYCTCTWGLYMYMGTVHVHGDCTYMYIIVRAV